MLTHLRILSIHEIRVVRGWTPFAVAGTENSSDTVRWWLGFGLLMLILIAIELFAMHRRSEVPSMAESIVIVAIWCLLAMAFNGVIWWQMGGKAGLQFATGYLLEWSLSIDNVFVFAVIFRYFQVPLLYQHRILNWGILARS